MSMVVWGHFYFGRTDRIEGLGKVATRFWHFMGVPIIPRDSWWLRNETWTRGSGMVVDGHRIPMNARSIALAYVRGWSIAAAVVGVLLSMDHPQHRDAWVGSAIVAAAMSAAAYLPPFRRASAHAEARWRAFLRDSAAS